MKKFTWTITLIFVLSLSAFADGTMHTGGRNCQPNQTCLAVSGQPDRTPEKKGVREPNNPRGSFFKDIFDFLQSFFV